MAVSFHNLLGYIRRLAACAELAEAADSTLLSCFVADGDERAFAALVDRHAGLVFQVCWRILRDTHDAQDALQATFLVLARKAGSIRPPEALPSWLHGVARRIAFKTRSARFRHQRASRPLTAATPDDRPDPLAELASRDFVGIIDEEVQRLAERYRLPVILCCLEGRSLEEAAQQLGWTPGSVKGRLERGRARLHERLVRRGLTLSAALAAVELSRAAATAAGTAGWLGPLVTAARTFAARQAFPEGAVSAKAAALAGDILKSMTLTNVKWTAVLLLATCLAAGGWMAYRQVPVPSTTSGELPSSASPSARSAPLAPPADLGNNDKNKVRDETGDWIEVSGRVLDPQGRPFAGAKLFVGYTQRRYEPDAVSQPPSYRIWAISDREGRFHFAFTRLQLDGRYLDASRPVVIAVADGFGLDWVEIGDSAADGTLRLRLVEDFPLDGRILDAQRHPVAGARVSVRAVRSDSVEGLTRSAQNAESSRAFPSCWGPLPSQPPQVTTDGEGRFRLTGLGRNRLVTLALEGPAIPSTDSVARTCPAAAVPNGMRISGSPFEYVSVVPRSIRGVVRDKATGQAVAGVKISVAHSSSWTLTDKEGRYEMLIAPALQRWVILAQPQGGQPYFAAAVRPANTPDPAPLTADFELVSGIPLQGRVADQATGKPPQRAVVEYYPLFPNVHSAALTRLDHLQAASSAALDADGTYNLTVLPGPGVVLVAASPRDAYSSAFLDEQELANLFHDGKDHGGGSQLMIATGGDIRSGRLRCVDRYNALSLIQPNENARSLKLDLTVRSAPPLPGIVVGPDGRPLRGATVIGLSSMPDAETLPGASFRVEGLHPRRTRELSFHHREKDLGKVLTLRGDETKALTVQLEPCGVVIGRIVDKANRPMPGVRLWFGKAGGGMLASIQVETDGRGRFRAALVPRLPYRVGLTTPGRLPRSMSELAVESGQTKDLGDVYLEEKSPPTDRP